MFIKKNKKILLFLVVFCATFMLGAFLKANAALVTGYLWGGTEQVSDGAINGNETGVGWIDLSDKVDVPSSDGNVSGYGWSENIGWVDFNPAGPYPEAPNNSVRRVGNNLVGWARIVSIATARAAGNSGGWLGWVKMHNVSIDSATGQMSGYAWSDELGWIDFANAKIEASKILNIIVSASPSACISCSSLDFDLEAVREDTSTTLGNIIYEFDCDGDGTYEGTYNTINSSQSHGCTVVSSVTAQVRVTQDGITQTGSAAISITAPSCGDGILGVGEECDDGAANNGVCPASCSASCTSNVCSDNSNYNWIEVAP
ncbi:MAG: hypothetical protein UR69_C0002G0173 [Candidatus Moranbacteria bacterium GW2011_GWE2_35_2-]|nr:MAG: hypothetical protein UR69_C0002G0173 [Candidatus Moranbacteria bacterium GW2011_GWE2_35_2-]KKQ22478.1 MAG: hypothetical protein US37_C0002G0103 [Candidatus Moranbacteria bacterium GW2011_GWF2_37_11]KKQ29547.1 MAG: hypothetical protein US44_C0001G0139 [Candidatus Moranbacteria bacterium GW2011_GWD1_37_17]KKQ30583.1 MAG: hypothetical protein US47_C0002G0173 [Candidatus Moranbacteria bacterium GW2011_GWE1_37_24]KKQ48193.1 MAG: hypothetical protein US66_C0001G0057 [Candidatus Moranbacteria 